MKKKMKPKRLLDKRCQRCRNTPRMLGNQCATSVCDKCLNIADSLARIKNRKQRRGLPSMGEGLQRGTMMGE